SEWLQDAEAIFERMQNRPTRAFTVPSLSGHVLLAEDWVDNQELIQMYIKRCGVKVTLAQNGQQAIEAALAQSFDLILMDVQMPEVDGIEATQILRATGFSNPIIALTANVSKGDIEQYLTHGFDDHLSKPIEREAFYQTLAANLPAAGEAVFGGNSEGNSEEQHDETYLALVASFLERLPILMDSIEQAAEQQNWQQMSGLLHNLKGLGGSFGYPALSQMAQPMVETLEAGQSQQTLDHLVELKHIAANITEEFGATLS
ncbi:MAG: response regulator, partial [Psychrosphaera sp.]|nr:response regulator [Psychrosphaera sp.]